MKNRAFAISFLAILLLAGVTGVSATAPQGYPAHRLMPAGMAKPPGMDTLYGHDGGALAPQAPTWQQVNADGFGDPDAGAVSALAAFNGYLYAGTSNPVDGARIFRSPDGVNWTPVTDPGFGIEHDIQPPAILDMLVFNGRLYASTGRGDGPAQIWRTLNGVNWAPMTITGFSNPDTVDITALGDLNSFIYAGATNLITGAQIWRSLSGDNNTWTQVAPETPAPAAVWITGMAVFDGALYAAIESEWVTQIWRSTGSEWTTVVSNSFGDPQTTATGGMAAFGGYLYVGAGNQADGAQLWCSNNGTNWQQVIDPGFGDPNNQKVEMVFVYQNMLYAGVQNAQTGIEVWRSVDGTTWEQANSDGFGDVDNSGTNWGNAVAEFLGDLYVGTTNVVDGGELWRLQIPTQPTPTPTSTSTPTTTPSPSPPPSPQPPTAHFFLPVIQGRP